MASSGPCDLALGPVLEFMRLLWAVDHGLQSTSKRMRAALGVTAPQRLVVRIVARHPGIAAGDLAALMHVHPSTLTGVLARLERDRLLARERDPADGRRARLRLTPGGRRLNDVMAGTVEAAVRRVLARVAPGDRAAVERVLRDLAYELGRPAAAPRTR